MYCQLHCILSATRTWQTAMYKDMNTWVTSCYSILCNTCIHPLPNCVKNSIFGINMVSTHMCCPQSQYMVPHLDTSSDSSRWPDSNQQRTYCPCYTIFIPSMYVLPVQVRHRPNRVKSLNWDKLTEIQEKITRLPWSPFCAIFFLYEHQFRISFKTSVGLL